jgi:hypothetical protein
MRERKEIGRRVGLVNCYWTEWKEICNNRLE